MGLKLTTTGDQVRQIRAIPTLYAGTRYRSRLEARWAVFFDTLSIKHVYEIQGFDVNGRAYLPDFLLPDQWLWAEVKSALDADPDGVSRWRQFTAARQERGILLTDMQPTEGEMRFLLTGPHGDGGMWDDDRAMWFCCPGGYHIDAQLYPQIGCQRCRRDDLYWYESDLIRSAFTIARSYRFGR